MVMESLQRLDPPRPLGKWTLLAKLGEGGMATVYLASVGAGALQRLAAVKLLRQGAPDHDYRTRFLDEAAVVVRLHHNNLVDVREAGEVSGQLFIAMELIEGRDLADIWDRCAEMGRAFPVPLAVHIVREILRGLHYAHTFPGLQLVHRDVSPSNVLVDWAGAVRLADFGLATSNLKAADTVPGMVFGKVGYMAPEQATRSPLDGRADVYGCGVVLWELLTGRPLRDSGTNTQAVAVWDAPAPSSKSSRVDPELDKIVVRALQRNKNERYDSAAELLEDLSGWLSRHAPATTQEVVAKFMRGLFADARERDHAVHESLLATAREVADAAEEESTLDLPRDVPQIKTSMAGRVSAEESIAAGTVVADRYRIEAPIGMGGMGTVFLAEHVTVGRKVAVKVLTHEWSNHPVVAKRFKEEARAASAAGHPNIVEVFDAGDLPDGRLFLVMEHLTGHSLFDEIEQTERFDVMRALRIIRDVARAIRAAHGVGIIHRDLKPDNIMLVRRGEEERVKVLDFGISASASRVEEEARLTMPGHALGTPEYMAPEQGLGKPATPQFDVYALGVILYEMLAGEPPFASENIVEVLTRKATQKPPPLGSRRPDLPGALVELCHACLSTEPAGRPATADAFIKELDPLLTAMLGPGVDGTEILTSTLSGPTSAMNLGRAFVSGPPPSEISAQHAAASPDKTAALPPPPSVADFDAALAGVQSGPNEAPSLVSTPVDFDDDHTPLDGDEELESKPAAGQRSWLIAVAAAAAVVLGAVGVAVAMSGPDKDESKASSQAAQAANVEDGSNAQAKTVEREPPEPNEPPEPKDQPAKKALGPGPDQTPEPTPPEPEPAQPEPATPKPEPATPKPEPVQPATSKTGTDAGPDPAKTPRCEKTRTGAKAAHDGRRWHDAIALLKKRECWSGSQRAARRKMLVKAYFETKQFPLCVKTGRGASDTTTQNTVKICKARVDLENG